MSEIKVDYVLLCDDARTEDNGKHIIIGLYSNAILIFGGGTTFVGPLAFFIKALLPADTPVSFTTWIEGPRGQRMQESSFENVGPPPPEGNPAAIIWRLLPFNSDGLGKFKLHLTQEGRDTVIHEFEVQAAN